MTRILISKGWLLLALFVLTSETQADHSVCTIANFDPKFLYYETHAEAQAACAAIKGSGCAVTGGTDYYCGGVRNWQTNYWRATGTICPEGESMDPTTGVCEDDGGGGSGCDNPIAVCTDPGPRGLMAGAPHLPDVNYKLFPLTSSEAASGLVTRDNTGLIECATFNQYCDSSGEQPLECTWTLYTDFQLTDDNNIRRVRYIGDVADTDISNQINCNTQFNDTQSWDIFQSAQTETETTTDDQGQSTTQTQSCATTRNYNATSGVTQVCQVCQTKIDGALVSTTESCYNESGDTTNNQDGEEGTGTATTDGNGTQYVPGSGSAGSYAGTDGTGAGPETGNTTSGASVGDDAELIAALESLTEALEEEAEGGPCDPEQPDYAECVGMVSGADPGTQDGLTNVADITAISNDVYIRLQNVPLVVAASNVSNMFNLGPASCPQPSFSVLSETFSIDMHCTLLSQFTASISAIFMFLWTLAGIRHLMSA